MILLIQRSRIGDPKLTSGWLISPPEHVVEVLSPTDRWPDMLDKAGEYLAAGVQEVWVADPAKTVVTIFLPDSEPRTLKSGESLTSPNLLPGFEVSLDHLFATS